MLVELLTDASAMICTILPERDPANESRDLISPHIETQGSM